MRELSFFAGLVGVIFFLFDWLVAPLLFPQGPWWVRIVIGAVGLVLLSASGMLDRWNKMFGSKASEVRKP
jgi:hypothetical protein